VYSNNTICTRLPADKLNNLQKVIFAMKYFVFSLLRCYLNSSYDNDTLFQLFVQHEYGTNNVMIKLHVIKQSSQQQKIKGTRWKHFSKKKTRIHFRFVCWIRRKRPCKVYSMCCCKKIDKPNCHVICEVHKLC